MLTPFSSCILSPVVILDKPQMGENIGAVARAMMNFGLQELRLVNPRDGWPNPKAHEMSANAEHIIESAQVFTAFGGAIADCHFVLAATARNRELEIPAYSPGEAMPLLAERCGRGERIAIVLGAERSGLQNEDIAHCQAICTIPTHPEMSSLNLAQSMVILGYEWWLTTGISAQASAEAAQVPVATQSERQALYMRLVQALSERGYYQQEGRARVMQRNLRVMLAQWPLSSQQVQSLMGMLRALTH